MAVPADAGRYDGRLFDAHLHLNWEGGFGLPVDEAIGPMRANGVTAILATSRPNDGARALVQAGAEGARVVAFLRPYRVRDYRLATRRCPNSSGRNSVVATTSASESSTSAVTPPPAMS